MEQGFIYSIMLFVIAVMFLFFPRLLYKMIESRKCDRASHPSKEYIISMRVIGGVMLTLGISLTVVTILHLGDETNCGKKDEDISSFSNEGDGTKEGESEGELLNEFYYVGGITSIQVKKINEYIYLLHDNQDSTGYVVVGSDKAVVIDTMCGTCDLKKLVEQITDLPLVLVNTHGHMDHIGGNGSFDIAYLHPDDLVLAQNSIYYVGGFEAEFQDILPGDVINLGDIQLEVYSIAGHTAGSIGLLERKSRILFTGDAINDHLWLQLGESLPLTIELKSLEKLENIRSDFDYLLTGHGTGLVDASLFEELEQALKDMIQGDNENDTEYEYYGITALAHHYGDEHYLKLVVYDPTKLE